MFETIQDSLRQSIEMYHYASYLLAIDNNKTCLLGETPLSAKYNSASDQNGFRKPIVLPAWRWPLGTPLQASSVDFIQNTLSNSPRVYGRIFTNGIILVCPDSTGIATINLINYGGPYYNPETGENVSNIKIQPHQGIVLLKNLKPVVLSKIYPPTTANNKSLYLDFDDLMDIPTLGVGVEIRELLSNQSINGEWIQTENKLVKFTAQTGFLKDKTYKLIISKKINTDEGYSLVKDTSIVFSVSTMSELNYIKSESKLIVYPNPTKHYITINDPSVHDLILTDLLGKQIKTLKRNAYNFFEINHLSAGNYIVKATLDKGIRKISIITISR